ncbi:SRPBCC family protein [Thermoactinomyces mirandus]|uniref:SRPBCC domain-containing protein n=1 Tax=Thermoactinomyces mirandus TaxID=2756294 RepID=A0A7W1XRJ0_9BACL|nr:SRPBCC domain-containing protein [Thermoactinomyces mirandus]MBA4601781.1 SRPBCC domain-containing protein [Thermoactinomyces mirandus]
MKQTNQKIKVEHVSIFAIQAPPEFCFSKLSDEKIRRRAQDVLAIQMEPEAGGCFVISYQEPTGIETVQMEITEYSPPSVLKLTACSTEEHMTYTYCLKRMSSGTRLTIEMQFYIDRNGLNVIIYSFFKKKMGRKWNDYWRRLALEMEKEFRQWRFACQGMTYRCANPFFMNNRQRSYFVR